MREQASWADWAPGEDRMRLVTWLGFGLLAIVACSSAPKRTPRDAGAISDAASFRDATSPAGADADRIRATIDGGRGLQDASRPPASDARTPYDAGSITDPDAELNAAPGRRIAFAAAGEQLFASGPSLGLQLTDANLAEDVDVIAVHQELYGVPWQAFENDQPPPPEWIARMHELAQHAVDANKPVFLSISPLNGTRKTLAARTAIKDGRIDTEDNWAAACYDFATAADAAQKRRAYLAYVRTMVQWFKPRFLNFAVEINLFLENCPSASTGLVALANAAYDVAKAEDPKLVAFASIQIDHLYGYSKDSCPDPTQRDKCFNQALDAIRPLASDRFAMSSYPYLQGTAVGDLPRDWFTRAANLIGKAGVIAETGWLSTDLSARLDTSCQTPVHGSEHDAADYLKFVIASAEAEQFELVTWWSDRDLLPSALMTNCPCTLSSSWCSVVDVFRQSAGNDPQSAFFGELLMKAFGTMGLRDYDGVAKSMLIANWRRARELPYTP